MTDVSQLKLVVSLFGVFVFLLQGCNSEPVTSTEFTMVEVCNEGMSPCPNSKSCRVDIRNCPTDPPTTPEPSTSPDVTYIDRTLFTVDDKSQSTNDITGSPQYDQSTDNNDMTSPSTDGITDASVTDNVTSILMTSDVTSEAEITSELTSDTMTTGSVLDGESSPGDESVSTSFTTNDRSLMSSSQQDELSSQSVHTPSSPTSIPSQTPDTDSNNTAPVSNSFVLVFKGKMENRQEFESHLKEEVVKKLEEFYNKTSHSKDDVIVMSVNSTGENNQTVITEAIVMRNGTTGKPGLSLVPPGVILSALTNTSRGTFFNSKSSNLKFLCGYLSREKPCTFQNNDSDDVTDTKYGVYEYNRNLFIAIFVTVTLFLILILAVLISIRCRQRRRATYVTNVTLEKANLSLKDETMGINNPLTDKEILNGEIENKNGAPPILPEDGWVVPLDEMPERKNSVTEDTKL